MTKTIAVDSAEYLTLPRTIRNLISEAAEIGGQVTEIAPRLFEFALPVKYVSGNYGMTNRATVGYYVQDGKNVIRGVHDTRREIAYWGKQARR